MGTNFYVDDCPRFQSTKKHRVHIGKNSSGWEFGFKAWSRDSYKFPKEIRSWKQWKEHILSIGYVFDEYDNIWDAEEFIAYVERSRVPYRHMFTNDMITPTNHYDYCKIHHPSEVTPEHGWKDEEGWSFSAREFS